MPIIEPLCHIIGIDSQKLTKEENFIVEAELFLCLCEEIKEMFRNYYKEYFLLMKFNPKKEDEVLEINFIRYVIKDILSSEEYSLAGIARYTQTPEDVIYDIVMGLNSMPSLPLSRKIIDLHRSVRPKLYRETMKKITRTYWEEVNLNRI